VERMDSLAISGTPASKLRPPRVWHSELTRSALLDDERVAQAEILAIRAPAGFGKTTLAIQWASRTDRPIVWVTLDEADSDALVLMATLYAGLEHALEDFRVPSGAMTLLEPAFTRTVLPQFRRVIGGLEHPITVVLDEMQLIQGDQPARVLRGLVESLPLGSQTAFVGRNLPGVPLPLWHGQGRVAEVVAQDLSFTTEETRRALEQFTGAPKPASEVERLQSATEGWPVAVYLASQSAEPVTAMTPLVIQEFIETEVLGAMTGEVQAFVCETAALGSVNAELARHATGARTAAHLLGTEITTVLLQHVGDDWYRYHPLLTACAIAVLAREDPERLQTVRCRAAQWHLERGHLDTAVQFALVSGDRETMGAVLWEASRICLLQGRTTTVHDWLARAGERAVTQVAALAMTAAWTSMAAGEFGQVLRYADCTQQAMPDGWHKDLTTSTIAPSLALLLAVTGYELDGPGSAAQLSAAALAAMSGDDPMRALAALIVGLNLALTGDPGAEESIKHAAALANSTGVSSSEVEALAILGLLQIASGRDSAGCRAIEEAVTVFAFHDLDRMMSTTGILAIARVALSAFRGSALDARSAIEAQHLVRPGLEELLSWYRPLAGAVMAFACVRIGDMDGYHEYLTWCDDSDTADGVLCRQWVDRARREYAAASPLQELSPAELRVWEFLRGRMTLSEIAEQLFLSRETVKSHTVSIYRKLGVASRRQAQDLAESWD